MVYPCCDRASCCSRTNYINSKHNKTGGGAGGDDDDSLRLILSHMLCASTL